MPVGRLRPECHHVLTLIAVVFLVAANVEAQTGGVTATGSVSKTVALSIAPSSTHDDVETVVVSSGSTVRMTLSGRGGGSPVIRVPLIVRSNIGFSISATAESATAQVTQLSVTDVRATGRSVAPDAVDNIQTGDSNLDLAHPFVLLSGPRVSLGGTLQSPNNALQITLLVRMQPQSAGPWTAGLIFVGTAR